jgi:hypothetical protein
LWVRSGCVRINHFRSQLCEGFAMAIFDRTYSAAVFAVLVFITISMSCFTDRTVADCGSGSGSEPTQPPYHSPGCWVPWATCACAAAGQGDGVGCDDGSFCIHIEITNPKVDYYEIAANGFHYPSFDIIPRYCRLQRVECNPFGSPPCVETGDRIMRQVFEADFTFTDPCP